MPAAETIDPGVLIAIIGFLQAAVVAIVGGLFHVDSKKRKRRDEHLDARAKIRAEESYLSMRLMSANTSLTIATAIAVKENKVNGKMESALAEAEKAQRDYYDFINRTASSQMTAE
jgi:hypothetical protein